MDEETLRARVAELERERDEARLWARAFYELDTYRWWLGAWGLDSENPPAWIKERLPTGYADENGPSLVDELISERREQAAEEDRA